MGCECFGVESAPPKGQLARSVLNDMVNKFLHTYGYTEGYTDGSCFSIIHQMAVSWQHMSSLG